MKNKFRSLLNNNSFQKRVKHHKKIFHANEKILSQGQRHDNIYFILKGKVRVVIQKYSEKGIKPGINDLDAEDIFGEFGLFDDSPANPDVIAVDETELIEIDIDTFRSFLAENPSIGHEIYFEMLKILIARLKHADKTIINLYIWGIKAHQIDKYIEQE